MPLAFHLAVRPVLALPLSIVLAAAFAALLAWTLWRRLPARRRRTLLALRIAAAAAILMLLFRPEMVWQGRRSVRGQVAFLLDASRSMTIRDAAQRESPARESLSRADAVHHAFLAAAGARAELAVRLVVRSYAFGSHLRPIGNNFAPDPADGRTDPGEALAELADRASDSLLAVVLVGDGTANRESRSSPTDAAARLRAAGARVHTLAVGSPEPSDRAPDLAVRDLRAPDRVFAGNRPEVRARVAGLGLAGRPFNLALKVNDKVVESRTITFDSPSAVREVVFTPTLDEPGLVRLTLEAEPIPGELIADNNVAETVLRVEEGGLRVVYLDGSLRPEGKYLARALAEAREMDLERRILVGSATLKPRDEAPQGPNPGNDVPDLDAFDVVILGDLAADALPAAAVERLAARVRDGKAGLVALGGLSAFGAGGWERTPLADLLPFAIRAGDGQVRGPLRFVPTPEGRRHFILNLDAAPSAVHSALRTPHSALEPNSADLFTRLPPLSGASAVGPLRPAAVLLAASPEGTPLLAVRDTGVFRSAALTADSTWLWVLSAADPDGPERHARLWRGLVLWAARRDEKPAGDLAILTDRTRYLLADPSRPADVEVRVYAPGADGAPRVRATAPDGQTRDLALTLVREGEWQADLQAAAPGAWRLRAETSDSAADLLAADTEFIVEVQDFELADLLADHQALQALAEAGGGTFRTLDGLGELLRELAAGGTHVDEPAERQLPLAAGRIYLALVLALLATDWLLRRRW